jgi:hypothetical protein
MSVIQRIPPPPAVTTPGLFRWFTDLRQTLALEAVNPATLENGWTVFGAPYAAPGFYRQGGVVFLQGVVALGAAGSPIFTLPEGYRPLADHRFSAANVNGSAPVSVAINGQITLLSGGTTWVSLDSINFKVR